MDRTAVVDKLTRRFQLGTRKELRLALYERLGRLVEEQGEEALHVIATVADDAMRAREPGKYFAYVVMRRLMERKLIPAPEL